ncbi:hypothetical protein LTR56_005593 [Elasticomyces elasticus]|nr:hypothetical protein LTR56_005593 [Elasticomyces elasticus]KAK4927333.1 hypothetical protein LTR49_005738 [Elasticomyces elasticus]KAK5763299.1 hypothetical protein LTS12_006474 [Elasticomyces elasticus]
MNDSSFLSSRAVENVRNPDHWAPLVQALSNSWSEANTEGTVILGLAENTLMHREIADHIKAHFEIDTHSQFTYGHGPQGSPRLRKALATFFKENFHALGEVTAEQLVIASGVSAVIDHVTWCICDEGEGILFPAPLYTGFTNDLPTRSRGKLLPVSFRREDGTLDLDDIFDATANTRCMERALVQAKRNGVKVKAVMITNPHNPLGKCYPPDTIKAIAAFCEKHSLHYLSDEIYANSVFVNHQYPKATSFHSVLSIDLNEVIRPNLVHVLYGAAKDFCANGLRLGALHTRSTALKHAMTTITTFSWPSYVIQDTWARILEDEKFLQWYLPENQKRLATNYRTLIKFLDENSISYFRGGNAGIFLWVYLGQRTAPSEKPDSAVQKSHGAQSDVASVTLEAEQSDDLLLAGTCLKNGVTIGRGSRFLSEEAGWFRITFSADEVALRTGLDRIRRSVIELSS